MTTGVTVAAANTRRRGPFSTGPLKSTFRKQLIFKLLRQSDPA